MTGKLTVRLRTLTPLWTGGVDGTMDRIHETGILGSLRWWYEAIVRGLGGEACDPTTHTCSFDPEKYRKSKASDERQRLRDAGLCDACQIFGATGWRRRFRLEVRPVEGEIDFTEGMFPSGRVHPDRGRPYRVGGWLLRGGYFGTLELRFTGEEKVLLCEILPTLLFIEKWGALGPKTSLGYGVIEITEIQIGGQMYRRTQDHWRARLREPVSQNCQGSRVGRWWWSQEFPPSSYQDVFPALTNMFFGKVRFAVADSNGNWWNAFREIQWLQEGKISKNEACWTGKANEKPKGPFVIPNPLPVRRIEHWVRYHNTFPLSPIVRTYLRYGCPQKGVKPLIGDKRGLFGFVEGKNRQQSRIRISWAYRINEQWEMRFWGWWPDKNDKSNIIAQVKKSLGISQAQTQERQWHTAQTNDTLWSQNRLNLKGVQVCWFSKRANEEVRRYLQALLQGCDCRKSHTETQRTRR